MLSPTQLPSYPWRLAHLVALWAYGVSQPVFSMLGGNPEFLVINGASRAEAVVFAVVLALAPPLVAVGIELVTDVISRGLAAIVHILFVWVFGFAALLQVLQLFEPSARATILLPAVGSWVGAVAYLRWQAVRSFLSFSVILAALGLTTFLATAPLALADAEGVAAAVGSPVPVVLLVFDELPMSSMMDSKGSVDAARYPGFGRLAREATWYSRATTVHPRTTVAVPAILTGDVPSSDALPTLADHSRNLFTLLGERYAVRAREPITRLCPVRYCPQHRSSLSLPDRVSGLLHDVGINYLHGSLPRDIRGDVAPLREGWGALIENTDPGAESFLDFLSASNPKATLYFLHLLEPHMPWDRLPSGRRYGDGAVIAGIADDRAAGGRTRWRDSDPWLVAEGLQRHLLQLGYVDRFLSRVLGRLDSAGIYDDALVIVTADHGVSFRPGGWRRHATRQNVADIAAVPLFVRYPGQKRARNDRRAAATIDILPTIADVLEIDLPWTVDGQSLRARPVERNVRLGSDEKASVVASPETVHAGVLATARSNRRLLGEGTDSLYRLGPRPGLLGRPVDGLPRSSAPTVEVDLFDERDFATVRKASGYVPVHVLGRIEWGTLAPAAEIAVAVNGRIAAVTAPFRSKGGTYLSTMIDEAGLHDGRNSVNVYAIRDSGRRTRLVQLGAGSTVVRRSRSPIASATTSARRPAGRQPEAGRSITAITSSR